MLSKMRIAARRTLVLSGVVMAAVALSLAAGLQIKETQVDVSSLRVTVANDASQSRSGTVVAVVVVDGTEQVLNGNFAVAAGGSTMVSLSARGPIGGVIFVGIIADDPSPF